MYFENSVPNDLVSRMQWAVWAGKGVTKLFDDIESRFFVLQSLFDLARQHPNLASLDKDHFTIISDYSDHKYLPGVVGSLYCVAGLIAPDKFNVNQARPRTDVFVESYRTTSESENESNKPQTLTDCITTNTRVSLETRLSLAL
jgi:hypothetical protein